MKWPSKITLCNHEYGDSKLLCNACEKANDMHDAFMAIIMSKYIVPEVERKVSVEEKEEPQ